MDSPKAIKKQVQEFAEKLVVNNFGIDVLPQKTKVEMQKKRKNKN